MENKAQRYDADSQGKDIVTVTQALDHLLHLTLRWVRHQTRYNKQQTLYESPASITTPLGYVPHQRHVNTNPSLSEGMDRARKREYAVRRKCGRVGE